uniref:Uncharacterized protein n=1 Tax=Lotharella globosa TaxID=91324 RepID=A0A7S3Z1E8_9EUKA
MDSSSSSSSDTSDVKFDDDKGPHDRRQSHATPSSSSSPSSHVLLPPFEEVKAAATKAWGQFWGNGASVDFSPSFAEFPERARELERRVVLSQYLMRVHAGGSAPPQETGLAQNSWGGKHHQEMRYWHHAHWGVWGRGSILAKSDTWFTERIHDARHQAAFQGYEGARWPKCVGPNNHRLPNVSKQIEGSAYWESFNFINPLLIWHQPHVISLAEIERRAAEAAVKAKAFNDGCDGMDADGSHGCDSVDDKEAEVRLRLGPIVEATAQFLASFCSLNLTDGTCHLGPPIIDASERHSAGYPTMTSDPVFELTYVNFTLDIANAWREKAGKPRNATWDDIRKRLAQAPTFYWEGQTYYPWHAASDQVPASICGQGGQRRWGLSSSSSSSSPFNSCGGPTGHPAQVAAAAMMPGMAYGINVKHQT